MSSDFVVSARKYRPDSWEKVVGQDSITSTLKNSIASQKLGQAYLFCGPRGVGKTTCARIFAHKINEADGIKPEDLSFNIFELDAASNNSVDDIRELTTQVRIPPQIGSYNVYVIDEVHMLSASAFNAFLKTLEEPPAHAVFILATTEKHKILPTILSRCQIFDFHRISVPAIVKHLVQIAEKENIKFEEEGLHIIGQKADGALRDALSIFDQMVSFSDGNLSYKSVIENLNVLDYDYYFRSADCIIKEDISSSLVIFNDILKNGFDGHVFINGLAEHFRNLLVSKDEVTLSLLEVTDSIKKKYAKQCLEIDQNLIIQGLGVINNCDVGYRTSKNQRLLVELTLMQLCSLKYNEAEKKNSISLIPIGIEIPAPPKKTSLPQRKEKTAMALTASAPLSNKENNNYVHATHGISLNGEIKKLEDEHQKKITEAARIAEVNERKDDVLLDKLELNEVNAGWKEFTSHLGKSGKKNLFAVLSHTEPKINEKNEIIFPVRSETDESYFNDVRQDLTVFLKGKLAVTHLSLRSEGVTDSSGAAPERKFLSEVEVLKKMTEQNPQLGKLKEMFDLDLK